MPGYLLQAQAMGQCPHAGQASVAGTAARVTLSGQPAAILSDPTTVAGCPFQVPVGPGTKPQPCVTVKWIAGAARVMIMGQPALVSTGTGLCLSAEQIPQGPPSMTTFQMRVQGS